MTRNAAPLPRILRVIMFSPQQRSVAEVRHPVPRFRKLGGEADGHGPKSQVPGPGSNVPGPTSKVPRADAGGYLSFENSPRRLAALPQALSHAEKTRGRGNVGGLSHAEKTRGRGDAGGQPTLDLGHWTLDERVGEATPPHPLQTAARSRALPQALREWGGRILLAVALTLVCRPGAAVAQAPAPTAQLRTATFAGGCFWCMEPPFDALDGVVSTTSGYAGGSKPNPTYEEVSAGGTGYAEAVQIVYDPARVSYEKLLDVYWHNVDPVTPNRQFCDAGDQYRTAIFYHDDAQKRLADASKQALDASKRLPGPVVTQIVPVGTFYPAEAYHQDYYRKNPIRYKYYRYNCGRDQRLAELWGDAAGGHWATISAFAHRARRNQPDVTPAKKPRSEGRVTRARVARWPLPIPATGSQSSPLRGRRSPRETNSWGVSLHALSIPGTDAPAPFPRLA